VNCLVSREQFCAIFTVRVKPCDVFLTTHDFRYVQQRLPQPTPEQSSTHRRACAIQSRKERRRCCIVLENFQAANRLRVERHKIRRLITGQASQLFRDIHLCIAQVSNKCSGG
jgi:hypothetical protein